VTLGDVDRHTLTLGDAPEELVDVERLWGTIGEEPLRDPERQLLGEVPVLTLVKGCPRESLGQGLERRSDGSVGAVAVEVRAALDKA
jgi:hypothetical protein